MQVSLSTNKIEIVRPSHHPNEGGDCGLLIQPFLAASNGTRRWRAAPISWTTHAVIGPSAPLQVSHLNPGDKLEIVSRPISRRLVSGNYPSIHHEPFVTGNQSRSILLPAAESEFIVVVTTQIQADHVSFRAPMP